MRAPVAVVVFAALVLCSCNKRRFVHPTQSMKPTIQPGEHVTGDMAAYSRRDPQRWDVILFDPPPFQGQGQIWAMRIVGLPGEKVSFSLDGHILINGRPLAPLEKLLSIRYQPRVQAEGAVPVPYPFSVPPDSYFVLGDNPPHSNDSRFWGAVPRENIHGKVLGK